MSKKKDKETEAMPTKLTGEEKLVNNDAVEMKKEKIKYEN